MTGLLAGVNSGLEGPLWLLGASLNRWEAEVGPWRGVVLGAKKKPTKWKLIQDGANGQERGQEKLWPP